MSYESKYIALAPQCALKRLEEPCLYDIVRDELYEINEEAYQFLLKCSQGEDPVFVVQVALEDFRRRADVVLVEQREHGADVVRG